MCALENKYETARELNIQVLLLQKKIKKSKKKRFNVTGTAK